MAVESDVSPTQEQRLEQVLAAYLRDLEAGRQPDRDEILARHPDLAGELQDFFAAHQQLGRWAEPLRQAVLPNGDPQQTTEPSGETAGTLIAGRYKLLEPIGHGGMGQVWMAEQRIPVKRLVALKLIKAGMDSRAVLTRFEAERQALALMDHANIARVFDGGTTAEGRPYFVMELVKGLPLTTYCDERRLSVPERLELFVQVCSAVQHAHQKGIMHRDLKPSNILVTEYDGRPVPKVIDFGLAKALTTTSVLTEHTLHTAFGTMVGTPLYMAPEQVGINALDVDTRTDIYALGVLLYELLTGTTPLERQRMKEAAWDEVRRLICEEEPPRPSLRLSSSDALPSLAASRATEPAKLSQSVRGDLDWIVLKALEKDRNRRYETANGLAMDIRRHLADEPVLACPPSAAYRFRKFARKNRKPLALAGAFVLLLAVAALVSTWQAIRATRAETKARQAEGLAEERFELAKEAVDKYLNEVTETPELKNANFESLRKKLLESALQFYRKLAEQAPGDPESEAARSRAYGRLAAIRRELGDLAAALADYQKMHAILAPLAETFPEEPSYRRDQSRSLVGQGEALYMIGRMVDAESAYRATLAIGQQLVNDFPSNHEYYRDLGKIHYGFADVLGVGLNKYVEAETEDRAALREQQRLVDEYPNVPEYRYELAKSHNHLGLTLGMQPKKTESEAEYRVARKELQRLVDEHPNVPDYRYQLADTLLNLGECRAALKECERLVGEHPNVSDYRLNLGRSHSSLGHQLAQQGKLADAEREYRTALQDYQRMAGESPNVHFRWSLAEDHRALGGLLVQQGKHVEAEAEYRAAITHYQRLADEHPNISYYPFVLFSSHNSLGNLLAGLGKQAEAETEYRTARKIYQHLADEQPKNATHLNNLAWQLAICPDPKLRDPGQAVAHAKKAVELAPDSGMIWNTLGVAQYRNSDWNAAIAALMKSVQLRNGGDSFDWFFLAMAYWQLNDKEKARAWYEQAVAWMDKNNPRNEELKRFRDEAAALLGLTKAAETQNNKK